MSQPNKQIVIRPILIEENHNSDRQEENSSEKNENNSILIKEKSDDIEKDKAEQKVEQCKEFDRTVDGVTIFCRICEDFIAHSVTTACQHTFCQLCLIEYMIYVDQCPQCGARIRHQRFSNNILLDNLIMDYIQKYQSDEVQIFKERLEQLKTYHREKKLNDFQTGMKIDVRDSDYVWCTGRIFRTINKFQQKKIKWMIVKYDKTNKKQQFPQNSPRIAPFGFYTNRKDIPRYHRGKLILQNQEQNVIYNLPNQHDQQEEKEVVSQNP